MKAGFLLQIFSACHKPLRSLFHGQKACRNGVVMIDKNFFCGNHFSGRFKRFQDIPKKKENPLVSITN
jgi:hypothetical protein